MPLIDTHCHLTFPELFTDLEPVLARAKAASVEKMICVACNLADAEKALEIAGIYPQIFVALALHPADLTENWAEDFAVIATLAKHERVVAIGETGLDFFRPENAPHAVQEKAFLAHIKLARELRKPLIIHTRAAFAETLEFLKNENCANFVIHCFTENMAAANEIFALGGMISFTGIVTFPKNTALQEVAKAVPLEKIMVETDSPFLAPVPERGKSNEPSFVRHTAEFIANLRGVSLEEFAAATTKNAVQFFGI